MKFATLLISTFTVLLLSACGGSSSGGDVAPTPEVPSKAVLSVSPASIELIAHSETAVTLTITNTSSSVTATAISALLPSSWTDVVQDASGCASLPPQAHCTLSLTPGAASHAPATVNISGHNTEVATAAIVVADGAVLVELTATTVTMGLGQSLVIGLLNSSTTVTAHNISARLAGTPLAANLAQDANGCVAVPPGAVCYLRFTARNTAVSQSNFSIGGDNTNTIGGSIGIVVFGTAPLAVANSPLVLQATAGTPVSGTLTIANLSADVTATNVGADFGGTALDGNVTQDASGCATLAPGASCMLTFTPLGSAVSQTSFAISGDNTSQVGASIAIDEPQATLSVSGSSLALFASGIPGTLVLTNTSSDTATNIVVNFTGTALDGNVTQTGLSCPSLPPFASCTLEFTPGSTVVPQTSFAIAGSNTNTLLASIRIKTLEVGDSYAGGIVMVLPSGGTPGTIVSASEVTRSWGGSGSTGATDFFNGDVNTDTIVAALGSNGGTPYAAGYCDALAQVDGGITYDDWHLPAYNDLAALIFADGFNGLGIFSGSYWSSSEVDTDDAYLQTTAPSGATDAKGALYSVRCARTFVL